MSTSDRSLPKTQIPGIYMVSLRNRPVFFFLSKLPFGMSHISTSEPTIYQSMAFCQWSSNSDDGRLPRDTRRVPHLYLFILLRFKMDI